MFFFFLFRSPSLATRPRMHSYRGRIHGPSVFKSVIEARIHAIAVRSWQPDNYSCLTRHHDQSVFPTPRAHACKFVHLTTISLLSWGQPIDGIFPCFDSIRRDMENIPLLDFQIDVCHFCPYLPHRRAFATSRFFFPFFFFTPRQALDARFAA